MVSLSTDTDVLKMWSVHQNNYVTTSSCHSSDTAAAAAAGGGGGGGGGGGVGHGGDRPHGQKVVGAIPSSRPTGILLCHFLKQ